MGNNSELSADNRGSKSPCPLHTAEEPSGEGLIRKSMTPTTSKGKTSSSRRSTSLGHRGKKTKRGSNHKSKSQKKRPSPFTRPAVAKLTLGNGMVLRFPENVEPYRICFNEEAFAVIESGEGNRFILDWEHNGEDNY